MWLVELLRWVRNLMLHVAVVWIFSNNILRRAILIPKLTPKCLVCFYFPYRPLECFLCSSWLLPILPVSNCRRRSSYRPISREYPPAAFGACCFVFFTISWWTIHTIPCVPLCFPLLPSHSHRRSSEGSKVYGSTYLPQRRENCGGSGKSLYVGRPGCSSNNQRSWRCYQWCCFKTEKEAYQS